MLFLGFLLVSVLYVLGRRKSRETIESIKTGKDVLVSWSYSADDWKANVELGSDGWIKNKDIPGEVFITPENIYVTNGTDEYFFEFGHRHVTKCSYSRSVLDLRVEWTQSKMGESMDGITEYRYEDFRLFVPAAKHEEVLELAAEFKAMAQANAGFFKKPDELISLFGDDKS